MPAGYVYLAFAIVAEVLATLALRSSRGFTSLGMSLLVVAGYATAFFMLGLTLRTLPVGVAYAIWSGVGTAAIAVAAAALFGERLTLVTAAGLTLIVTGIVLLQLDLASSGT